MLITDCIWPKCTTSSTGICDGVCSRGEPSRIIPLVTTGIGAINPLKKICFVNCGLVGDECECYRQMHRHVDTSSNHFTHITDTLADRIVMLEQEVLKLRRELLPTKKDAE
jgi:hypothetical protein